MKSKLFYFLSFIFAQFTWAQIPNWQWSYNVSSNADYGRANRCVTDTAGNVIVIGSFHGGTITFGNTVLTNSGGGDMYVTKFNSNGNVLWATSAGGTGLDEGYSCAVDDSGNIYVAGTFASNTFTIGNKQLTTVGGSDIFIAKYNAQGNVIYANKIAGSSDEFWPEIACDNYGRCYVGGTFLSNQLDIGGNIISNYGSADIFMVRYDAAGVAEFVKSGGNIGWQEIKGIKCDKAGNVYLTGNFEGGNLSFGAANFFNAGGYDFFLINYNTAGNELWWQGYGDSDNENAESIAIGNDSNLYIAGSFSTPNFIFGTTTLVNSGGSDFMLCKLNYAGVPQWALSAQSVQYESLYDVAVDDSNNVYGGGYHWSTSLTWGNYQSNSPMDFNAEYVIVKADASGNHGWIKTATGNKEERCAGIAVGKNNDIFSCGWSTSDTLFLDTISNIHSNSTFNPYPVISKIGLPGSSTDFQNLISNNSVMIYPNPFHSDLYLANSIQEITIFDLTGREILHDIFSTKGNHSISTLHLIKGIYFASCFDGKKFTAFKLIKN